MSDPYGYDVFGYDPDSMVPRPMTPVVPPEMQVPVQANVEPRTIEVPAAPTAIDVPVSQQIFPVPSTTAPPVVLPGQEVPPSQVLTPPQAAPSEGGLRPVQRAFLQSMAVGEAKDYNVLYGDSPGNRRTFNDYSDHPRLNMRIASGPNEGRTTSAAGKYQFLQGTWDEAALALGLTDFSPASQDKAAAWLAERDYRRNTRGRDLWSDLESAQGDPRMLNAIGSRLSGTWTSLPGGIERNQATHGFGNRLASALRGETALAETPGWTAPAGGKRSISNAFLSPEPISGARTRSALTRPDGQRVMVLPVDHDPFSIVGIPDYLNPRRLPPEVKKAIFGVAPMLAPMLTEMWPEKTLKDAITTVGDIATGKVQSQPGYRREDFTDKPRPGAGEAERPGFASPAWIGYSLGLRPVADEPVDPLVERAMAMSNVAATGGAASPMPRSFEPRGPRVMGRRPEEFTQAGAARTQAMSDDLVLRGGMRREQVDRMTSAELEKAYLDAGFARDVTPGAQPGTALAPYGGPLSSELQTPAAAARPEPTGAPYAPYAAQAAAGTAANVPAANAAGTALDPGAGAGGGAAGAGSLAEAQAAAARSSAGAYVPQGLPQKPLEITPGEFFVPAPLAQAQKLATDYAVKNGIDYKPPQQYVPVNPERATRIAQAFEEMPHAPDDPKVKASYKALADETVAQMDEVLKAGLKIEFIKPDQADPYAASPRLAHKDVTENNHLWVFPTDLGFGMTPDIASSPMLAPTKFNIDGRQLLVNDVFRIVHDYFGHFKDGNGFRADGEEHAWRSHSAMYSDAARPAMTSETRGQNSWVNYGPHAEANRRASGADTVYAEQKTGLLPDWAINEGRLDPVGVTGAEKVPGVANVPAPPAAVAQTSTPQFQRWFGASKVVDESGTPKVMYHTTTKAGEFEAFKRRQNDIGMHFGTQGQAEDRFALKQKNDPYGAELRGTSHGTIPVYLSIKNPLRMRDVGAFNHDNLPYALEDAGIPRAEIDAVMRSMRHSPNGQVAGLRDLLERKGYDGIVYKNTGEVSGGSDLRSKISEAGSDYDARGKALKEYEEFREQNAEDSFIAFRPNQIKSAIGNTGEFDPKKPSILYSDKRPLIVPGPERAKQMLAGLGRDASGLVTLTPVEKLSPLYKQFLDDPSDRMATLEVATTNTPAGAAAHEMLNRLPAESRGWPKEAREDFVSLQRQTMEKLATKDKRSGQSPIDRLVSAAAGRKIAVEGVDTGSFGTWDGAVNPNMRIPLIGTGKKGVFDFTDPKNTLARHALLAALGEDLHQSASAASQFTTVPLNDASGSTYSVGVPGKVTPEQISQFEKAVGLPLNVHSVQGGTLIDINIGDGSVKPAEAAVVAAMDKVFPDAGAIASRRTYDGDYIESPDYQKAIGDFEKEKGLRGKEQIGGTGGVGEAGLSALAHSDWTAAREAVRQIAKERDEAYRGWQEKYRDWVEEGLAPGVASPNRLEQLATEIPGLRGAMKHMTPDERVKMRRDTATKVLELLQQFPGSEEMAAVGFAGRAKRGWYRKSAQALVEIFGVEDAPRFAALLASLSPQSSVEKNLLNALHMWANWTAAGRPVDARTIGQIMGRSVEGTGTEKSVLDAWRNNTIRSLRTNDPTSINLLSGPKVQSFARNLRDHVNEVTNDAWMANYADANQDMFGGTGGKPDDLGQHVGKSPGYIAMSTAVRRAAQIATEKTGHHWTPSEIQETVWSWAKTLFEKSKDAGMTTTDFMKAGNLTHELIANTPDFGRLFLDNLYRNILERGGYGKQIEALAERGDQQAAAVGGGRGDARSAEGSGFAQDAFDAHLERAAARLEEVRNERAVNRAKPVDTEKLKEQLDERYEERAAKLMENGMSRAEAEAQAHEDVYKDTKYYNGVKVKPVDEDPFGGGGGEGGGGVDFFSNRKPVIVPGSEQVPTFYSGLQKAVMDAKITKAPAEQWLNTITPRAKKEEMDWIGLPEWLAEQKGSIPKEAVEQFVREKGVRIEEETAGSGVTLNENSRFWRPEFKKALEWDGLLYDRRDAEVRLANNREAYQAAMQIPELKQADPVTPWYRIVADSIVKGSNDARFENLQMDGPKQNYRSVALTMPGQIAPYKPDTQHFTTEGGGTAIAWARMNDREIDGKRTLFTEEIQSKRHQDARNKGYMGRETAEEKAQMEKRKAIEQRMDELDEARNVLYEKLSYWSDENYDSSPIGALSGERAMDIMRNAGQDIPDTPWVASDWFSELTHEKREKLFLDARAELAKQLPPEIAEIYKERATLLDELEKLREQLVQLPPRKRAAGVPDAPFKSTPAWAGLVLKRLIKEAAESGHDQIAWTPGEVQADRYSLAQHIDTLRYYPERQELVGEKDHDVRVNKKDVKPEDLPALIGKDMANKLLATPQQPNFHQLEGTDLKLGGEGMKEFYDKILVNTANAIGKKYGAKVTTAGVDDALSGRVGYGVYRGTERLQEERGVLTHDQAMQARRRLGEDVSIRHLKEEAKSQKVWVLPITPEMRKAATGEGFTLFMKGVPVVRVDNDPFEEEQRKVSGGRR